MPRAPPITAPSPAEPTAQPIRAPRAAHARIVPIKTPPAAAGWKEGRAAGSIGSASITLVTAKGRFLRRIQVTLFRLPAVRTLLIEAAVIAIGIATAVTIIYVKTRPKPVHVERRLAGREQDVSRDPRVQYAPALALDPANPRVLLGGSSDSLADTRVYSSADEGENWTTSAGPPLLRGNCKIDRPAVAIAAGGRQLFAFGATEFC